MSYRLDGLDHTTIAFRSHTVQDQNTGVMEVTNTYYRLLPRLTGQIEIVALY